MNKLLRIAGIAAVILLQPPFAHAIDRSECKQYGGAADCWQPVVGDWSYGTCGEVGAFLSYDIAVCAAQGGTWGGSLIGCQGLPAPEYRRPTSEGDISPFSQDIFAKFYGPLCEGPSATSFAWGGILSSVNCGFSNGASINQFGYEVGNTTTAITVRGKRLQSGVCNATDTVLNFSGSRRRSVGCGTANGQGGQFTFTSGGTPAMCSMGFRQPINPKQDCEGCKSVQVANPIDPNTGTKRQVELDYAGSGPQPLRFERVYNSRTYTLDNRQWRHNYSAHVENQEFGTRPVALAYRPSGRTFLFALTGSDYVADTDIDDRLTRLTDSGGALTGWQYYEAASDSTETYDAEGRLLSIVNRAGLAQTLEYSTAATPLAVAPGPGFLLRVTDAFGRQLNFTYDQFGRMATLQDPAGQTYVYEHTTQDHFASVTYPDGKKRTYLFNEPAMLTVNAFDGRMTGTIDENNSRFSSYFYDIFGIATRSTHAGGVDNHVINNGSWPNSVAVTDPRGTVKTYSYQQINGAWRNTTIAQPAVSGVGTVSSAKTYDVNGNVATQRDFNGNRTNFTYDLSRNLETSRTEGLTSAGGVTPATRTIETQWHPAYRLRTQITERNAGGTVLRATSMSHDAAGNVLSRTVTAGSSSRTWSYTYNANGSVLTMDGPRTDVSDVTSYTYYANDDPDPGKRGNLSTITNAAGHVTSITEYNAHGQPLTVLDSNGLVTTLAYDLRQRLTSRSVGGELTSYEYDGVGQLTKVTLPDGSFLSYTYDAAHRLTGIQDTLGNRIAYALDAMGNRTAEEVRDPGNILAQTRSRVLNNLNRLFQEIGAASQTTQYAYDNQGNVTSVDGPLAGTVDVTANGYDALNRLIRVTDPNAGQVNYGYNALDQLASVTDPRNLATTYGYNGLGDLNQQVSPDTGTTVNTYDSAGNLLTQTDAKGQVTSYVYDALNRVTSITFHDGSKQNYAYDQGANGIGRLSVITEVDSANQVTGVIAYTYDPHGRVTAETRMLAGIPYVTAYAYDSAGRMSGMTYPSGRTVTYGLDTLGRVSQVETTKDGQSQVMVQGVSYHPFGGVTGFALGNGQSYTRSVDLDGRIASYTLGGASYALSFDPASRITAIGANSYGYDALDRLSSAVLPATSYGYSYDAVGNRLSRTAGAGTDTYAYPATSNRIASITPASGPVRNFGFDANGSTTADDVNTYTYDARGRMVRAVSVLGTTNYQVNALGQRVRKTNSLGDTVFHYDTRGRLIAETDAAGSVKREYVHLGDLPVGLAVAGAASGGSEAILDNSSAAFSTTGTWPVSTAVAGYIGANYQSHEANGAPPSSLVVDNSDAGFSTTGTWTASTSVSGYVGANYQHHYANGEPPSSIVADNASGAAVGTWPASTSVGGYLGANYQVHVAGTGASTFTWTLNAPSAGSYGVYARWTQHPNRATNAKYTVNHAGGATVVTMNQELGGGLWNLLGTFNLAAGAVSVSLSDEANDYVVADGVMLVPPGALPNTATWSASLPGAGTYQVYARWTQHPNRATDAKYTVNHAGGATTVTVNQEAGGGTWSSLGSFSFNAGSASVSLTDQANGYVIADAVMFAPPGAGANSATWTPNVAQAGTYEVYARWTAHANRATNASYAVTHAGGTTLVAVNQQLNGGIWNLLGTFSLSPGSVHKVTLTDQANGYVIADALRLVPISLQTGPQYYYAHPDHLNTPRLVADATGTTVWRWDQAEPFGVNVPDENPSGLGAFDLPLRLPGQYFDKETNLHYNYFRDYDPSLGRYEESDPIGLQGGLNTYAYVDAGPLGDADPLGLVKWTGSLTVVDLGVGPKVGKHGPRIPVLRRNQIQLVLESECVAGKKQHATIRAVNPESGEWRHSPQTWLAGSVTLEDGLSVPDARQLQGTFTLDMFGLFYARGIVSTGGGVGTFSGLGLVGGGYNFRGRSYLLFPPKEESCVCKPKE